MLDFSCLVRATIVESLGPGCISFFKVLDDFIVVQLFHCFSWFCMVFFKFLVQSKTFLSRKKRKKKLQRSLKNLCQSGLKLSAKKGHNDRWKKYKRNTFLSHIQMVQKNITVKFLDAHLYT